MSDNEHTPFATELANAVSRVEHLLQEIKSSLQNIEETEAASSLNALLSKVAEDGDAVDSLQQVFIHWQDEDLPAYEQSEISRALTLIKRSQLMAKNAECLLKKALGIPDPEREQAEIAMQLRAMSAMHQHFE